MSVFCFYANEEVDLDHLYNQLKLNDVVAAVRYCDKSKGVTKKWKSLWRALFVSLVIRDSKINIRVYKSGTVQWSSGLTALPEIALWHVRKHLPLKLRDDYRICNHISAIRLPVPNCQALQVRLLAKGFKLRYQISLIRKQPCLTYHKEGATINYYVRSCTFCISSKTREIALKAITL